MKRIILVVAAVLVLSGCKKQQNYCFKCSTFATITEITNTSRKTISSDKTDRQICDKTEEEIEELKKGTESKTNSTVGTKIIEQKIFMTCYKD